MKCRLELIKLKTDFIGWITTKPKEFILMILVGSLFASLMYCYAPNQALTYYSLFATVALTLQIKGSNYLFHPVTMLTWLLVSIYEITNISIF